MNRLLRCLLVLSGVLTLSACLVTPGKFDSSLDIRADHSFSFVYKGEILASETSDDMTGFPSQGEHDDDEGAAETGPAL